MTGKMALERIYKYNNHYIEGKEYLFLDMESEEWKTILQTLEINEFLKPIIKAVVELKGVSINTMDFKVSDNIKEKIREWLNNEI